MTNPFFDTSINNKHNAFAFDKIKLEHFMPAFDKALATAKQEIEAIRNNTEEPTFENTMMAMERAGYDLGDVTTVYFNLMSAHSDNEFKALAQQMAPQLAEFSSSISMCPVLFGKIKALHDKIDELNLNEEQTRLLEKSYKGFVRSGALLNDEDKKKLMMLSMEASRLNPQFSQNVLGATNAFEIVIENKDELKGIPESALAAAAHRAEQQGKKGYLFNLQIPSLNPVLTYCENRELRQKLSKAYSSRAFNDEFDNQELVKKIAGLRQDSAELLGYNTHAHYVLTERMAQNTETVMNFLNRIYDKAIDKAKLEVEELKKLAKELDGIEDFKGWDAGYYSEKLKKRLFDFNEEDLRPYFEMNNVLNGVFEIANKLYGINFNQVNDIPVYHEDVKTYEVTDKDGSYLGLLYMDLYPRATKNGGAWMTTFRTQGLYRDEVIRPHVAIVASLTPPAGDMPSLLNLREVTTIFHEFGHALHALLSDAYFTSLASPNVWWDFVELPSQIMENWATETEALELFAKHYKTGEIIPNELIEKIKASKTFNAGIANIRQLGLGFLDMAWHSADPRKIDDVNAFENEVMERTRLYPKVDGLNTSCSFGHIFAGGYASGYYSYKWAEALEADAFEYFKENGIFNTEIAESFRNNILSQGNKKHPMDLYVNFRGRKPDPDALLRRDGLL